MESVTLEMLKERPTLMRCLEPPSAASQAHWRWVFLLLGMLSACSASPLLAQPAVLPTYGPEDASEDELVQTAKSLYVWAYPMVNLHNRRAAFVSAETLASLGQQPLGASLAEWLGRGSRGRSFRSPVNRLRMQTDYIGAEQRFIVCPNQDVAYGIGFCDLGLSPVVFQVPDFGTRYWSIQLLDQRSDVFGSPGKRLMSAAGHYLIVGPGWEGDVPDGILHVYQSPTRYAIILPRVFLDDSPEDHAAIQPLLNEIMAYPVGEFTGDMKTIDWRTVPSLPSPRGQDEFRWVQPEHFWKQLPVVLDEVPPLEGEEGLYSQARTLIELGRQDPAIMSVLRQSAIAADESVVQQMFEFRNVGHDFGSGWTGVLNGARFGRDYVSRTAVAKAYMLVHLPEEAIYLTADDDAAGRQLDGAHNYTIRFAAGELPPVAGFWSLTVYDQFHFFAPNELQRYSLGTKNESLRYERDGSLKLYLQHESPGPLYESNWLPVPAEPFSVMLRCYLPDSAMFAKSWRPPPLVRGSLPTLPDLVAAVPTYLLTRSAPVPRTGAGSNAAGSSDVGRRSRRRRSRAPRARASTRGEREPRRPRRARG